MSVDLFLNEKKFISVSRASKETGYTSDYIGQLCRHGKIPSRLVGRSWFVDVQCLLDYQKNVSIGNTKKSNKQGLKMPDLASPRSILNTTIIKYESDSPPELPAIIKKTTNRGISYNFLFNSRIIRNTAFVISFFVLSNIIFSWIDFVSPDLTKNFDEKIASSYKRISLALNNLNNNFSIAQVKDSFMQNTSPTPRSGVVAFPDSKNRQQETNMVKKVFSDEMEVSFDETGESGVIRPVFRSGKDAEDYAFVLVPIKEKK